MKSFKYVYIFLFMLSFACLFGADISISQAVAAEEEAVEEEKDVAAYISLNPIIVPILSDNGDAQLVTIILSLEVPTSEAEEKVEDMKIRLVDAFITDMYGVLDNNHLLRNGYVDVARMKKRLGKISDKVLGENVVSEVLVKGVQQRRV